MTRARPKPGLLLVAVAVCCAVCLVVRTQARPTPNNATRAFLQDQLPLTVVVTTPVELSANATEPLSLSGRQALTAVFSRPVIALGSDFGVSAAQQKVPFRLSCPVPGKSRWVTTAIFRFDPDVDWPTDLDCTLNWVTNLTSYDGAPLDLGDVPASKQLTSAPLELSISRVRSELAQNLTGNQWASSFGRDSTEDEVPPGGTIILSFTYPVYLRMLRDALQIAVGNETNAPTVPFVVTQCRRPSSFPRAPGQKPPPSNTSLEANATCAEVTPKNALQQSVIYQVRLPEGARYNPIAGPLGNTTGGPVTGLRPFKMYFAVNLTSSAADGTDYRRLDLWLLHGLSPDTSPAALAAQISLCELPACAGVPFNLTVVNRGRARLSVPSLKPATEYRLSVAGNPAVKDGFGQGLQPSDLDFWTSYVDWALTPPQVNSPMGVLEAGTDTLSYWPYIGRGPPPSDPNNPLNVVSRINTWAVDVRSDAAQTNLVKMLQQQYYYPSLTSLLGGATGGLDVPPELQTPDSGADWTEIRLPLQQTAPSTAFVVNPVGTIRPINDPRLLLNSSLSFNVIQAGQTLTAWVVDAAAGGGSGPLAGAAVTVYYLPSRETSGNAPPPAPVQLGRCTTGSDGVCTLSTAATNVTSSPMTAFAVAGERVAVLPRSGYISPPDEVPRYVGSLVADRKIVVPGDALKMTGFVQQSSLSGLTLPPATYAVLEVSPSWTSGGVGPSGSTYTWAKVNGSTGTLHVRVPVPADATPQQYGMRLRLPKPGSPVASIDGPPDSSVVKDWPAVDNAQFGFVVSNPRPPTADLRLEVPPWAFPNGSVPINVTAISYIGASVVGAVMNLTWRTANASDVVRLTTDREGRANVTIDLGSLPEVNRTGEGSSMSVDVTWIGPTRERIVRSGTVYLVYGPARLSLSLSLSTDLPLVAFAPFATLTSNSNNSALPGIPVEFTLRPDPQDLAGALCATNATCTSLSGAGPSRGCQLALPCVGRFVVEGCAQVPYEPVRGLAGGGRGGGGGGGLVRVCANQTIGRNVSQWRDSPLRGYDNPVLTTDKTNYTLGETVRVRVQNPWLGARLLLQWGNEYKIATKVVPQLDTGLVELPVGPLGAECLGGCRIMGVLDVPRVTALSPPLPPPEQLPVSRLFDPRAPHTHDLRADIQISPDNALNVTIAVNATAEALATGGALYVRDVEGNELLTVEPGETAQITVSVRVGPFANGSAPPAGSVELTVYALDKAFLDLLPYPLPQPEDQVVLELGEDMSRYGMESYRIAPGAVRAVYDTLLRRLTTLDPWLPLDTSVSNDQTYWRSYSLAPVDSNDTYYLSQYASALTYTPEGYPRRGGTWSLRSTTYAADSPTDDPSNSDDVSLRQAAEFVVTPLFVTVTPDAEGRAVVPFKAPQNMGTFVIRAFAAAGATAKYGAGEGQLVVRRRLSLTPSVPRFVRVGDSFEGGVIVTVLKVPATVTVTLRISQTALNPLTATGPTSKTITFTTEGGLQQEVRFSFTAAAVGNGSFSIRAVNSDPSGGKDEVALMIPIEGQQGEVTTATTFALNATSGPGRQWQEGLVLPDAVPGSGGLTLTAGVGYFPAINATYAELLRTERDRTYAQAQPAVLWATLPAVLSYYGQQATAPQVNATQHAFRDLPKLTRPSVGLLWTDPSQWSDWTPSTTDIDLNTWALFLAAQYDKPMSSLPYTLAAFSSDWAALSSDLLPTWRDAVARQVVADAADVRSSSANKTAYSDWNTLAWVRLTLGAYWDPPNATEMVAKDLSLESLLAASHNVTAAGLQTRVLVALMLQSLGSGNPDPGLLSRTVREVTSGLRTQGRTAYVAAAPGAASALPLSYQALSLLLLLRSGASHPLVPQLAAYVASPGGLAPGAFSSLPSWTALGLAGAALTEYDSRRGSGNPDLDLEADVDGLTVLKASFRPGGNTSTVSNTTAWEDLPPAAPGKTAKLNFTASGRGEVTVSASLRFVPAALPAFPTYRGIFVESALQLVDPLTDRPTGPPLAAVPLASNVALTLQITSPDELGAVQVDVLMPGGLEPLDPNVAAGVGVECGAREVDSSSWAYFYPSWSWPVCPAQTTRPDRVTFSYGGLRAGTSSVTVRAIAASAGAFVFPPARAFAVQQPELMGMTAGASLVVCANCTGPTYGKPLPPPAPCPADCSGNGVCNLRTGSCVCDPGWTRPDCSGAAVARRRW